MTQTEAIRKWKESARHNLQIARDLLRLGHFDWALFMGQLVLEKLFKGLITSRTGRAPPYIHDLKKLADVAGLSLTREQMDDFQEITTYHIKARYEDIKRELYKKATKEYAGKFFTKIEEYARWLESLY